MRTDVAADQAPARRIVIVGGGIAGVQCAETLSQWLHRQIPPTKARVILISATAVLRRARVRQQCGRYIRWYDLEEESGEEWNKLNDVVEVLPGHVVEVHTGERWVRVYRTDRADTARRVRLSYDALCLCTGARPRVPPVYYALPDACRWRWVTIRDTDSVERFRRRVRMLQRADDRHPARTARRPRLAVLGNGGIAMEIAYETMDLCDVYWVVRDTHIGSAFFDAAVADILYRAMRRRERQLLSRPARLRTSTAEDGADDDNGVPQSGAEGMCGPALGPDWVHFGLRDRKSLPPARGASRLGRAVMGETEALTTAREAGSAECVSEDDDDDDDETSAPDGDRHLLHVECNAEVLVVQPVREAESTTAEPPPPAGVSADTPLPPPPPGDACSERLRLHSSNGHALDVDLVLCAIGVCPAVHPHMFHAAGAPGPLRFAPLPSESRALTRQEAGDRGGGAPDEPCGLVVDRHMRAAVPSVYAAGDCCTVDLSATAEWGQDALAHTPPDNAENGMRDGSPADPPLWFQMRLWSQAQTMGACAARSILHDLFGTPNGHHEETTPDGRTDLPAAPLDLELFVHATEFGGLKVILLGRYQAQGIADDGFCFLESAHCDDAQDVHHWWYVRATLWRGRLVGAVLLGDTGLEEVYEHLMLNRIDVSFLGTALVDGSIDIEDFFD
ncbi:hypothetical protein CDCA_CDCA11G3163 [Cyanidium caldarium]|uniref:FAD/NAD(P)-binding domain-containing protein n=1 Tax=Cyanidium caldarium TaxID=2771 RepID=A0AAV9IZA9_CYACA|nr:hypothetical protein CDCA_CDCA11G3163 [Cyanidium caldarium]